MKNPTIKIVDLETGIETEREMNASELAQYEADQLDAKNRVDELQTKAAQKAALLAQLGITEDQVKLLLS